MRTLPLSLSAVLLATTAMASLALPAWAQTTGAGAAEPGVGQAPAAAAQPGTAPSTAPVETPQQEPEAPGADPEDPNEVDAIVVVGNVPLVIRETAEVASVLTAEDLARSGDDNAAAALTRVTGLSLVAGRFVYVRGLGERYSSALLNGSPLPSPEPLQRVVPLDLFPASVLANVLVQKTYSPNFPGEFGGGVIALTTTAIPNRPFLSLGASAGGNTETHGETAISYYGSELDVLGYDDGTRDQPDALKAAQATGKKINSANFSPDELAVIGRSLVNAPLNLLQYVDPNADAGFDLSAGTSFDLGWGQAGVVAVLGYDNSWRTRRAKQQEGTLDEGELVPIADFDVLSTQNNVDVNALLGFGLDFGDNELRFTNLYVHSTIKEARIREGVEQLFGSNRVRDDFTEFFVRTLTSHQLTGAHEWGELTVDWRAAYAKATRDSPYEKEIRFEQSADGLFRTDTSRQRNRTRFSEIEDQVLSGGLDLGYKHEFSKTLAVDFTGGYAYLDNDRQSEAREFRFQATTPLTSNQQLQRPDFLFSNFNIGPTGLQIIEVTGPEIASYDAQLEVHAAYAAAEAELQDRFRLSLGVRYEDGRQSVRPFDLFGGPPPPSGAPIEETYLLPAATLTYLLADGDMQIRAGASKTIARPQFRELAPSQFIDIDTDRIFTGNPFLQNSELLNLDARYEWYFASRQFITAGLFYKSIENPVEAIVQEQGGTIITTFINAPKAVLYGAEFEVRKYFEVLPDVPFFASKRLLTAFNYTYSKAEIEVGAGDEVFPLAANGAARPALDFLIDGAPLQGQSEHLLNLQFGYEDEAADSQATFLLTYVADRVSARGRPGQPDFVESPGVQLDFTFRKGFKALGRELSLGFEARNLLGENFEELQEVGDGRIDLNTYERGRSVSVSLGVTF